jgi:hypothetical protein
MARRTVGSGPGWIPSLRNPSESAVPWIGRDFPVARCSGKNVNVPGADGLMFGAKYSRYVWRRPYLLWPEKKT